MVKITVRSGKFCEPRGEQWETGKARQTFGMSLHIQPVILMVRSEHANLHDQLIY
jgi:hypothetical protein